MRWPFAAMWLAACSFSGTAVAIDGDVGSEIDGPGARDGRPPDGTPLPDAANPPDAAMIDATPVFDREQCPSQYDYSIPGVLTSYYRPIFTAAVFATVHSDCLTDTTGWTHLIVPDATEAQAWGSVLGNSTYFYIGAVQDPTATTLAGGWNVFTGGPIQAPWSQKGTFGQPDDQDGTEDGFERLALSSTAGTIHDVHGATAYFAVCECDGTTILPEIAAMLP